MDLDVETRSASRVQEIEKLVRLLTFFMLMYSRIIHRRISSAEIEDFSERKLPSRYRSRESERVTLSA